jgi:hypothetical protein
MFQATNVGVKKLSYIICDSPPFPFFMGKAMYVVIQGYCLANSTVHTVLLTLCTLLV